MSAQVRKEADRRADRVEQRVCDSGDSLPGERDALPPGTLPGPNQEPHGDENREPIKPPMPPP
jgi:hypothetical protein